VNQLGRIKTKKIKRNTQKIYSENSDKITNDYSKNKEIINQKYKISSKKLRNTIAGYCTRLKKSEM
jgi:small subunit ribosomal protein S17e